MVFGKKFTHAMHSHCHAWKVGWNVLQAARTGPQQAFAYGYLSHLAADVFSHNHFVPTQLVLSFGSHALGHAYWEARFDTLQNTKYRALISTVLRRTFPECDRLAKRVVARTIFSFRTNKRIFESVLAFHNTTSWYRIMRQVTSHSRHELKPDIVVRYNAICQAAILDVLRHGKRAQCQKADPIGMHSLSVAKDLRYKLKVLQRRRAITPEIEGRLQEFRRREDLEPPRSRVDIARGRG